MGFDIVDFTGYRLGQVKGRANNSLLSRAAGRGKARGSTLPIFDSAAPQYSIDFFTITMGIRQSLYRSPVDLNINLNQ